MLVEHFTPMFYMAIKVVGLIPIHKLLVILLKQLMNLFLSMDDKIWNT